MRPTMALFRWRKRPLAKFDEPLRPEARLVVVGDIHGRFDLWQALVARLHADEVAADHLICVGDYIDRGDNSAAVLREIRQMQATVPEGQMICLLGNHEQMMLDFLRDPEEYGRRWVRHGGLQTLESFGVSLGAGPERDWMAIRDALRAALGSDLETWLKALPLSWQSGNLFVAHAGANPGRRVEDQDPDELIWGGSGFYDVPRQDGIWVAHGHRITADARLTQGRIPVDTGAYATGRLTAAVVASDGAVDFIEA